MHCTAAGELFAGIYEDDGSGGWLRVPRGSEAAVVIAERVTPGARAVSGDRVATVAGGGMITDDLSHALRLTVFEFTSGVSRTSPLDGPPDTLRVDVGLFDDELAVAFVRDSDGESATEVWTYTLGDNGPEVTARELLGAPPIGAATRQQFAAFGFTKSMQLVLPDPVLVELAPDISRNITPVAIGVGADGLTSIVMTPYGIATSVDGVVTMLDTPFGGQRWLRRSVLLDGPVAVDAIEPDPVVARAPEAGAIVIDDVARSQLWSDYPVVGPPRDPALDASEGPGQRIALIGIAAVASLVAIGVFIWRRRAPGVPQ